MRFNVGPSAILPEFFSAEAVDHEGEGAFYVVVFACPDSEEMAEEYAAWKNTQVSGQNPE